MKYTRYYIYVEHFVVYKRFFHAFHQLTKGKFLEKFSTHTEELEFAR